MGALFRRGELKLALLDALGTVGPANGYVIMQTVADELDGEWQPSPGSVYPALLGLLDAGLIDARDDDGTRIYELSTRGRRALTDAAGTMSSVAARARSEPRGRPLGKILDEWVTGIAGRDRRLDEQEQASLAKALADAQRIIEMTTSEGHRDG